MAGFIHVPEEVNPFENGEWSDEFEISITRPPFYQDLVLKPLSL